MISPTSFPHYTFTDMPDGFEELLVQAEERLDEQVSKHDDSSRVRETLGWIEVNTGLTYRQLNLVIIALRAVTSKNPEKTLASAITVKKIGKWFDRDDSVSLTDRGKSKHINIIGEDRTREIRLGEIFFQRRRRYYVSTIERWIRSSTYVSHAPNYGQRIGEELALYLERKLQLSEDEGNWLAQEFAQAETDNKTDQLAYRGRINNLPIRIKLPMHEGGDFSAQTQRLDKTMPIFQAALGQADTAAEIIYEEMTDEPAKKLHSGVSMDLTYLHTTNDVGVITFNAIMEKIDSTLQVDPSHWYGLYTLQKYDVILDQQRLKGVIDTYLAPAARGSDRNRTILEKRAGRKYTLDVCPVTTEILRRLDEWKPEIAEQIRTGHKKQVKVPAEVLEGIASPPEKGNEIKITFNFSAGRIQSNVRINQQYQWIRNGLYGPGTFSETVLAGMIGSPAQTVFDHPFSKLMGPVSSVKNYRDTSVIRFRTKTAAAHSQ